MQLAQIVREVSVRTNAGHLGRGFLSDTRPELERRIAGQRGKILTPGAIDHGCYEGVFSTHSTNESLEWGSGAN